MGKTILLSENLWYRIVNVFIHKQEKVTHFKIVEKM